RRDLLGGRRRDRDRGLCPPPSGPLPGSRAALARPGRGPRGDPCPDGGPSPAGGGHQSPRGLFCPPPRPYALPPPSRLSPPERAAFRIRGTVWVRPAPAPPA